MKVVFILALIVAVIMSAGIGCLVIFEIIAFNQGMDYILKSLATIALLGISSAVIAFATSRKDTPIE